MSRDLIRLTSVKYKKYFCVSDIKKMVPTVYEHRV